mmetsp:Transcript_40886/g.73899  ORF Transcript_40886/g.73899 Transcript_40886/m.73899 type:complete len:146 (-) Transcript_40886:51-488(-)
MIRVRQLEECMRKVVNDGVTNVMIFSQDGGLIAVARDETYEQKDTNQTITAVLHCIWHEYKEGEQYACPSAEDNSLDNMLIECQEARIAISSLAVDAESAIQSPLVCVCGTMETDYGALLNKLALVKAGLACIQPVLTFPPPSDG